MSRTSPRRVERHPAMECLLTLILPEVPRPKR